ncbi:MAG TPA: nucleotide-binding protein [Acidimicrobiia bacterium]|nr:nucleotide-binding protein [Acidimicrobiia bacterium]
MSRLNYESPRERIEPSRTVFVVHGRNLAARGALVSFLRALDLRPLEWTEAIALTGRPLPYIGEVLDAAFAHAQAIVVLMTPDDEARLRPQFWRAEDAPYESEFTPQARSNVLFEAGLAMGKSPHRTVIVELGALRPFTDLGGRHTVHLDGSAGRRHDLAERLRLAGCEVNTQGVDWLTAGDFALETELLETDEWLVAQPPEQITAITQARPPDGDDEPGFIEILAAMEESFPLLVEDFNELSIETRRFGDLSREATNAVEESDSRAAGMRGRLAIALKFAEDMEAPVARFEQLAAHANDQWFRVRGGITFLLGRLASGDLTPEEHAEAPAFLASMAQLRDAAALASPTMDSFNASLETLGRIARPVGRLTRRLRSANLIVIGVMEQVAKLQIPSGLRS